MFHDGDDAEGGEVGEHVDEHVVYESGHTEGRSADDAQHDVPGLGDGGVGEEAFEVLLAYGEEVGQGDGGDDDPVEDGLPFVHERGEDFVEDGHEDERGGAFGDDGEVGGDAGGGSLVDVGRPLVEGDEGEFEAQSHEEEDEGHQLEGAAVEPGGDVLEVERAGGAVD